MNEYRVLSFIHFAQVFMVSSESFLKEALSFPIRPDARALCFIFFSPPTIKKVSHILAAPAEEVQQYVKNGSRAIRGRVFPEYVCIEDVDKIISSVQRAPEEAAGRGETGKHLTASETRFTPIDRLMASVMNGKGPACSATQHKIRRPACYNVLKRIIMVL